MSPLPEDYKTCDHDDATGSLSGEEVVISGISGIFPNSNNVKEFADNLYNKVDMISSDDKFKTIKNMELPKHVGKISGSDKFDAHFFRVTYGQVITLDPVSRKLMEQTFSAMFDAGINPMTQNGTKLGVFVSSLSDSAYISLYNVWQNNKFVVSGTSKTMAANRISYWINGTGPSYAVDTASAGSMSCLEIAYKSIKSGECEAAVVGGANLCSIPNLSINLRRAGHLCLDGKTKCFDKNGDGFVRSEAVNVIFLQKAKDAKRIYAEVVFAKGKYFLKPDDLFLPMRNSKDMQQFLEEFYSESNVSSNEIEYVEAYGSGIAKADSNELEAIGQVFGRKNHVKVGSVNSNMGNSEVASGICAVTKVCLAYQKGQLPANLHYHEPQDHVAAVRDGRIQVLTENTPFNRGYTAINNLSYTGCNYHVLLKGHYKAKKSNVYASSIPYILLISGRLDKCVDKVLTTLNNSPIDPEQIALLHNIYQHNIPGHTGRGYTIIDKNEHDETLVLGQGFEYHTGETRPVWFMYSGMGSQWAGMGAELMRIPIFAAAIERCHKVLQPKGMDVVKIITDPDKKIFDSILNTFVGITAIQIGLTDILNALGIVPDKIIGHSAGEVGCAYADNCLTIEETILSAYYRGLASVKIKFIRGSMAAIGLGYKDVLPLCPPEIVVACHNSPTSSTISGPADIMKQFVSDLTSRGIFAKEVPTSNIAYHSHYISDAGPVLLSYMKEVIKEPKLRSDKWLSTSVPQEQWDTGKYASAEYFNNNLLNPVYFEETAKMIPNDAIVIEIAPHGLLQAIVKRSHGKCTHVPLTRRNDTDPVTFLLKALGNLYQVGLNLKVHLLYPQVKFPVSTETPSLSDLVEWDHIEQWPEYQTSTPIKEKMAAREVVISYHDNSYKYLEGHVIDGQNQLPESALLVLVWETLAIYKGVKYQELSVIFENVQFYEHMMLRQNEQLKLHIVIQKGGQRFEVTHQESQIMSGFIKAVNETAFKEQQLEYSDQDIILNASDVYKMLALKGYSYKNEFQSINSMNIGRNKAQIKWAGDWVTFLDSLIQFNVLASDHDAVSSPKFIISLSIDIKRQYKENATVTDDVTYYNANHSNEMYKDTKCGGVKIQGMIFTNKPKKEADFIIQKQKFIPFFPTEIIDLHTSLEIQLQIVAENTVANEIIVREMYITKYAVILQFLKEAANKIAAYKFRVNSVKVAHDHLITNEDLQKLNMLVVHNLLKDKKLDNLCYIKDSSFVLCVEHNEVSYDANSFKMFNVITCMSTEKYKLILLKKASSSNVALINLDPDRSCISLLDSNIKEEKRVILVSDKERYASIEGFIKTLRINKAKNIGILVIEDCNAPVFNKNNIFYTEQLNKNIINNTLRKGQWGHYYCLSTDEYAVTKNVKLINTSSGNFDDMEWEEIPTASKPNSIQICYSGISLKDCQSVLEKEYDSDKSFGMDFSGYDNRNERVMGVVAGGALGSSVEADPHLLWPVPEHWTLEDAATVPLPYVLAYYCLKMKGQLCKQQSVFVTGGAGALGQAVITLCLAQGCTVYTTVSNYEKKKFLMKIFPQLNDNNIIIYLSHQNPDTLLCKSKKNRCDLVINCASGMLREAAMKCVAPFGSFLDINEYDSRENNDFGMSYLMEGKSYMWVNVSNIFKPENIEDRQRLQAMISVGIANGIVKPMSRVTYLPEEVSKAFGLLTSSGHRGRVLIRMKDFTRLSPVTVKQRITLLPAATYVVVCDEYVLGCEFVDHLIRRGANKIILHVKTDLEGCYLQMKMSMWKKFDVTVEISSENLEELTGCEALIKNASALGPVQGIFVVQYYEQRNQAIEDRNKFEEYCKGTSAVLANLDHVSRKLCDSLSYFVIICNSSQELVDEHAIATADRICEEREEIGLPRLLLRVELSHSMDSHGIRRVPQASQILTVIISALEMSINRNYTNIVVTICKKQNNLEDFEFIAKFLEMKNMDDIDENTPLGDFAWNDEDIEQVRAAFEKSHQINLPANELKQMMIARLKATEKYTNNRNSKCNSGLGVFYNCVPEDLYLASEPMITMETLLTKANELDVDFDPSTMYLMMIPGFDGYNQIFKSISERLKIRAVTMQLDPDSQDDSIEKMAMSVFKQINKKLKLNSNFYFLGYSFGVNIALELAALMEKEGRVGVVYCLDSSPDALRVHLKAYMGCLDDNELQNTILCHIFWLTTGKEAQELKEDLEKFNTWSQKLEFFIFTLKGFITYSHQYLRSIADAAYKRIKLAQNYDPCLKLDSKLVLIKGVPHPKAEGLTNDYNLSKYTTRPVQVLGIDSDHASAPQDFRVSSIINSLIDPQLLEEHKNHCDFYFK